MAVAVNHSMVPVALLATKLYIPQARSNLVPRPRLMQRLNTYVERKLTLLSAPAGFGKTTLLSAWHASPSGSAWPLSWLSLDKDDNAPVRFVSYVIAALQSLHPDVGERALVLLHALQSSASAVSSGGASQRLKEVERFKLILTSLINDIAALAEPCVLIVDDYHVIEARVVHDILGFLLEHLPHQLRLVVASRSDLPLPLAGLRARGQLHELRADDLRFTVDEAAVLLNQVMGLALSAQDIAILESRIEGWVAGLQLAALSMQGQEDVSGFVKAFAGSHRYVLDYLMEEVLSRQPPRMRQFLLDTSVLERLSGPLCQAVTGLEDSREILEALERANLFVVPLDEQRRWYRYHHLFAEFLRVRLRQRDVERLPDLHRRAARWYEAHGFIVEAVNHALAAEDFEHAAGLVERVARDLLGRSELGMLRHWLNALPAEILEARPRLNTVQAWVLIASAQFDLAEARIQKLQAADVPPALAGELAATRATVSIFQGDWERTADLARQAQELVPEEDEFLRGIVAMDLGIPHILSGNVRVASQAFAEVARLNQKVGNPLFSVLALCQMAELQVVLLIVFLLAFNTTRSNIDERRRELATMFAFGTRIWTVVKMSIEENLIIGLLGTALGIGLGWAVLNAMVTWRIETLMPELSLSIGLAPMTLVWAVIFGVLAVALTPVLMIRQLVRMDIPSTLRVVE